MVSTRNKNEFVVVDPSGLRHVMLELAPSPENYRNMLIRIIEGTNDADDRTWAKSELIRIQDVEEWHVPRYSCIELDRERLIANVQCNECSVLIPGDSAFPGGGISEDQILSSEVLVHFGGDWHLMFLDNVNDESSLNITKMRDAAIRRAILEEGWGHDDDYHDGSYKAMSA